MEGGNPHKPDEWYRSAYAYVVTEEEEEHKWYTPVNPVRASQRDPRQVKAIARQHAIAVGLPYDPPSYSEAVETRPENMYTPPPIVAGLQWLPQHSVTSKPTKVDEPDAEAVTASAAADWKVYSTRKFGVDRYADSARPTGVTVDPDAPPEVKEVMPSFQYTGYNDEAIGNHSPTREGSPITREDWQEDWSVAESISPSKPGGGITPSHMQVWLRPLT